MCSTHDVYLITEDFQEFTYFDGSTCVSIADFKQLKVYYVDKIVPMVSEAHKNIHFLEIFYIMDVCCDTLNVTGDIVCVSCESVYVNSWM